MEKFINFKIKLIFNPIILFDHNFINILFYFNLINKKRIVCKLKKYTYLLLKKEDKIDECVKIFSLIILFKNKL